MLICKNYKIIVPKNLQNYVVYWYHTHLLQSVTERTEASISQHYYWHNLRNKIHTDINFCTECQKNKKQNIKYGKLPSKEAEAIPWDELLVYLIGQYKIRIEVTMIYPETGWFEIIQ